MALTLRAAIGASDTTVDVAGADEVIGGYIYSIGSEYVEVRAGSLATLGYGEAAYQRMSVYRGVQGTTKAAHDAGAALTRVTPGGGGAISATDGVTTVDPATSIVFPAGTLADLGGGMAGVSLMLRMLGPFSVAFDSPGLQETGGPSGVLSDGITYVDLGPIPDGAFVLQAIARITTDFNGSASGNQLLQIGLQPEDDPDNNVPLNTWKAVDNTNAPAVYSESVDTAARVARVGFATAGAHLYVNYNNGGGTAPTAGAADISAIIATPAS